MLRIAFDVFKGHFIVRDLAHCLIQYRQRNVAVAIAPRHTGQRMTQEDVIDVRLYTSMTASIFEVMAERVERGLGRLRANSVDVAVKVFAGLI